MKKILSLPAVLLLLAACSGQQQPDEQHHARVVPVYAFMRDFDTMPDSALAAHLTNDSIEIEAFMRTVSEMPADIELLQGWAASQPVEVFTPAVDSVFTDTATVSTIVGNILHRAAQSGIVLPHRRYATVVYGRPESILFVDSVMLIALNHYLGADYPGYSHWPAYMRNRKTPQNLPCDIAEALTATQMPYAAENEQATALSRMLYEGALAYVKMQLTGCTPAEALGYTPEQYADLLEIESPVWHSIVSQQLLYDTSPSTADRLVAPAPAVNIISPQTPGRSGRFIGYRIVEAYLSSHPDTDAATLLSPEFYTSPQTLVEAAYNPSSTQS